MNFKFAVICALFFVSLSLAKTTWEDLAKNENYDFLDYIKEFNKQYKEVSEFAMRKQIFEDRLFQIRQHNSDLTKTWKEGVNRFTDQTDKERKAVLGLKRELAYLSRKDEIEAAQGKKNNRPHSFAILNPVQPFLASEKDWRKDGVVSSVKDQGDCGSCWTFATAETVESHFAIKTGKLPVLSEQQILDCTPNPNQCGGTGGCNGGTAELALAQMINVTKGLSSEWTYPYTSYFGQGKSCQFSSSNTPTVASPTSFVKLPSNNYQDLMSAISSKGPIAISVDASVWHNYESGVFDGCDQSSPVIDHAVQLVGYGDDSQFGPYWLVRNSWGVVFGEAGYIRLKRNASPVCGVDSQPLDGDGCKGGPSKVTVCGTCGILFDSCYPTFD